MEKMIAVLIFLTLTAGNFIYYIWEGHKTKEGKKLTVIIALLIVIAMVVFHLYLLSTEEYGIK